MVGGKKGHRNSQAGRDRGRKEAGNLEYGVFVGEVGVAKPIAEREKNAIEP